MSVQQIVTQMPVATNMGMAVQSANTWRDYYKPMRQLTVDRIVSRFEFAQRGLWADIQWLMRFIERFDEDLMCLINRRVSALQEMEWKIKIVGDDGVDTNLAEAQAQALREAYGRIDNLTEVIEHLAMATFREYSHAQLQKDKAKPGKGKLPEREAALPSEATHIECLENWNFIRDGLHGNWWWNPNATNVMASALPPENEIDPQYFVSRVVKRPLNVIAVLKYIRSNLAQKDWDAFIETYGIPGWVVFMPPSIPAGKEQEYQQQAENLATGGSGSLPHGSEAKCVEPGRGTSANFKLRLDHLTEKLILAGTGGLLTSLAMPGSGTLAGSAHMEAFKSIARAEAREISEVMQRQFDKAILEDRFPGKPHLAYFTLCYNEDVDVSDIIDNAVKLFQAGLLVDPEETSEKTGYKLTRLTQVTNTPNESDPITPADQSGRSRLPGQAQNRRLGHIPGRRLLNSKPSGVPQKLIDSGKDAAAKAFAADLKPVRKRLEQIMQVEDPQLRDAALKTLQADLPKILKEINGNPESAKAIEDTLSAALLNGITESSSGDKS